MPSPSQSAPLAARWAPLICLALLACNPHVDVHVDPSPPAEPTWTSGKRLRAHLFDGGDGAIAFDGWTWKDTGLDQLCSFASAEDGAIRCLPIDLSLAQGLLYLDASCTQRGVVFWPEPGPWKQISLTMPKPGACGPAPRVAYEVGSEVASPTLYSRQYDGTCTPLMGPPIGSVWAVGAKIDPAAFVAGHDLVEAGAPGLSRAAFEADDGARVLRGGFDTALGARCFGRAGFAAPGEPGDLRCVPNDVAWMYDYVDAACAGTAVARVSDPTCSSPTLGFAASSGCGMPIRIYALGAPSPPVPLHGGWYLDAQVCGYTLTAAFAAPTSEVAADHFQALTVVHRGTGRLRSSYVTGPDGRVLRGDELFDSARGRPCRPERFTDGVLRCVPDRDLAFKGGGAPPAYADPACTKGLAWADPIRNEHPCDAPAYLPSGFAYLDAAHAAGPKLVGTTIYVQSQQGCVARPVPENVAFYEVGPAVDISVFPTVTEREE